MTGAAHGEWVMRDVVRDYLRHVGRASDEVRDLEGRIRVMRERLDGLGYDPAAGRGGGVSDKMADGMARIAELEAEWCSAIDAVQREHERMRTACGPSDPGAFAAWIHFAERRTWAYAARVVGYSERQVKRLAEDAMPALYALVPEEFKGKYPNAAPL